MTLRDLGRLLLLYYLGVLPEIASALDEARLPMGKSEFSVLDLVRDAIVVVHGGCACRMGLRTCCSSG